MKVVSEKYAEGCLEGKNVWDYTLAEDLSKRHIDCLGEYGKLIYNTAFEKPFFRLIVKGGFTLKGIEGKRTIRALMPENAGEETRRSIINILENS